MSRHPESDLRARAWARARGMPCLKPIKRAIYSMYARCHLAAAAFAPRSFCFAVLRYAVRALHWPTDLPRDVGHGMDGSESGWMMARLGADCDVIIII